VNPTGWTNSSGTTSCDDGLWCNGTDTCNGSGACSRQFPSGNRCAGAGICDKTTCSESSQTCYEPSTKVCSSSTEDRCSQNDVCGAKQQRRTVTKYCSGTSSGCDGSTVYGNTWSDVDQCTYDETCSSAAKTCVGELSCTTWCDGTLCWQQTPNPTTLTWSEAVSHCSNGTWSGRTDWRLPTAREWVTLFRGCQDGISTGDLSTSLCTLTCNNPNDCPTVGGACDACTTSDGPDTDPFGCFWNPSMDGLCMPHWTNTKQVGNYYWEAHPQTGSLFPPHMDTKSNVRCVVTE
jgi:hypothetical protein